MPLDHRSSPWIWTSLLLVVVCLPRLSTDMYLPSLPAMADALHASDSQLQMTLTLYMVGFAFSMLLSGPLCDRFGRRPVLLGGTLLYVVAAVVCAIAQNAEVLIVARMFSQISMGMALSPMIAPVMGSLIATAFGWRAVFTTLAVSGAAVALLIGFLLPETRPPRDAGVRKETTVAIYARLLRDRYFLRYSLAIGCVYCTYFPFIAESSTLLQRTM